MDLAPALHATLGNLGESLAITCPNGPSPTPTGSGHQWFRDMGWTFRDPEGLRRTAQDLDNYLGLLLADLKIPAKNMVLLGFSQGAMTLLHALPTLTHQPGALISCCGALTVPPSFPAQSFSNPQPILFLHGQEDDVLPADTSVQAAETYAAHGYPTQLEILPGLGHGINAACLAHISVFLQALWATPE